MSLRILKIRLWERDNRCHWCRKPTVLTDIKGGQLPPNSATIDHLISRLNPARWVKKKKGQKNERRRVLACYSCNQKRSFQETLCLSRAEIIKRSRGYSLSPKGKPKIIKPLPSLKDVLDKLDISDKV